jgi:2-polyprenyl-3-methyl-5-hydroxy-6-metoxy-1,4-benzoquinol methylase
MGGINRNEQYYDAKEYWEWRAKKYGSSYKGWKAIYLISADRHYFERLDMLDKKAVMNFIDVHPDMTILDVGCGVGRWCREFAGRGANVTGIDISEEMIRITKSNMERDGFTGHLMVKRVEEIDFRDNSFDLVLCVGVLEHITDPDKFRNACAAIVRVTRPGGQILVREWAPKIRREFTDHKHIVGRACHEYKETLEGEGAFLVKERGVQLWTHLDQAYGTMALKLASLMQKRSKCTDKPADREELIETTHPKLTKLFHLGRRAIVTLSTPIELYLLPLRPFRGLSDSKILLFQKKLPDS